MISHFLTHLTLNPPIVEVLVFHRSTDTIDDDHVRCDVGVAEDADANLDGRITEIIGLRCRALEAVDSVRKCMDLCTY